MPEVLHLIAHAAGHTILHTLPLIPFLFLSYLLMEYLERRAEGSSRKWLARAGHVGPLIGGALGMLPQCGFSAAASGLYTGRLITTGTLIAVYLSTSDEMLPILISAPNADLFLILKLLGVKLATGIVAGFCIDGVTVLFRRRRPEESAPTAIEDLCERERCDCCNRFWLSAIKHTVYITGFILLFTFAMEIVLDAVGEEALASLVSDRPVISCLLAALVGLIPNCASSIALTSLYLEGVISAGAMLSGLFVNAGVGLAVLFRNNRPVRDSFRVLIILLLIGISAGILIDITPLGAWLAH